MSERPPDGWDTQTTPPASVEIGDEGLAGHLRRRGAHSAPRTLTTAILARVDETSRERRWRLTLTAWRPRMAVAISGLALVLVASLLYISATPPPIGTDRGSPSPSSAPSRTASDVTWDPAQRALTPPELLRILSTNPSPGTVLIVDDQIAKLNLRCPALGTCPNAKLVNAGVDVEPPTGGNLPFDGASDIRGPLAFQVIDSTRLVFLGSVVSNGPRMEFRASDLAKRSATGGLFVVPAWLWASPCASAQRTLEPLPTSERRLLIPFDSCYLADWLTDTEADDPARGGVVGFPVLHGAHARYADSVANPGRPGLGTYLVRDEGGHGEILARLEPMPVPSDEAVEPTAEPSLRPSPSIAGGIVMSSDELVSRVLDGSLKAGSIAVASIPAAAVKILQPYAGAKPEYPWVIVSESRAIRVEGLIASGIVGVQAFVVGPTNAVMAIGQVATNSTWAALQGGEVLPIVGGLTAVHGWLRVGPPLPCPAPPTSTDKGVLGEPLAWSQCPGTWILPTASDPWAGQQGASSGTFGDPSVPAGTLHVQDGTPGAEGQPREGLWLVRAAKASHCPPGIFCTLQLDPQPSWGVTWYELVGPIAAPNAAAVAPSPPSAPLPSGIVLTQEQLIASIGSGAIPIGSIVIAKATIAPVILPSFPPDAGAVAGKIGPLRVHWASDPSLSAADLHQIALRVRPDGDVDYLGPVAIGQADGGSTNALFLVQTLQGPVLLRRIDCDSPQTPAVCPLAEGDTKTLTLGPVFVPNP